MLVLRRSSGRLDTGGATNSLTSQTKGTAEQMENWWEWSIKQGFQLYSQKPVEFLNSLKEAKKLLLLNNYIPILLRINEVKVNKMCSGINYQLCVEWRIWDGMTSFAENRQSIDESSEPCILSSS